jgi:LPS export ABC transporter protein LptC
MTAWLRSLRGALILGILGIGVAVVVGLRDRAESTLTLAVKRTDPHAVIQTRGSRIIRADALGESFRIVADRQDTYQDGGVRLVDNIQVTVADRKDRVGLVLTGDEAALDAEKTSVKLTGGVEMKSSDGLSASTDDASYSTSDDVIRMPGSTTFRRDGMDADGDGAEYHREDDVLRLLDKARIDLSSNATRTRILARTATVAQTDRYMKFSDNVTIKTDSEQMMANRAHVVLKNDDMTVKALDLMGDARIVDIHPQVGDLREMTAHTIELAYDESGAELKTAVLAGGAKLQLSAADGATGSTIRSRSIRLAFGDNGIALNELIARHQVELIMPPYQETAVQTVSADLLTVTSQSGAELEQAKFEGNVTFQEVSLGDGGTDVTMIVTADRLDTTLVNGINRLGETRFFGDVTFENEEVIGVADEAIYAIQAGRIELLTSLPVGRTPRVEDHRGSVQAHLIALGVDENRITAEGEVKNILLSDPADVDTADGARRPGLLEPSEPTYVTAGHLVYAGTTHVAVYSQGVRLWQTATEFVGDTIILDERSGNISAAGHVRTRSLINQINDVTGLQEKSAFTGTSDEFFYDNTLHRAMYTTDAQLTSSRGDLRADQILVFLGSDNRTLDRIEATGHVELTMPGRSVTGESLVFYDVEGRYEMKGGPVESIEEIEAQCRKTTGQTLTFFLTEGAVSVDGESKVRTEILREPCPEGTP